MQFGAIGRSLTKNSFWLALRHTHRDRHAVRMQSNWAKGDAFWKKAAAALTAMIGVRWRSESDRIAAENRPV
jgi:hypothetical protein